MNNEFYNIIKKNKENFFGFFFEENKIKFYIPEILDNDEYNVYYMLKRYNNILNQYIRSKNNEIFTDRKENFSNITSLNIIESYLNLLEDWHNYNDLMIYKKDYKNKNKHINWNKTFKKNDIIFSKNNIIYGEFISKNKIIDNDNKYYLLYYEALRQAKEIFLALPTEKKMYPNSYNEQRYYLYKYLESHFKDRENYICKNLISIFLHKENNNLKDYLLKEKYHTDFEFIWENMINEITKKNNIEKKLNRGYYEKNNENGISLKIDTLLEKDNKYYILDSKFYNSYINKKMPSSKDLMKQFGYKLFLHKFHNIEEKNLINIFLFPKNTENKNVEIFNIHKIFGDKESYFDIYCIAIDINIVIDLYLKKSIYNELLDKIFSLSN